MKKPLACCFAGVCVLGLWAVETRTWRQGDAADFEKASLKRIALRSDGRLMLAPAFVEVLDSGLPYLWALARDSNGIVYAGGGGPGAGAAVWVMRPGAKPELLTELEGLEVHALAVDRQNRLYAATSPDGKVYRVAPGKIEVFYEPKAKYIWALAFNSRGELFVATGDPGTVHRVSPDGNGSVFFDTEETHARSMAVDSQDNLIIGTEPGGLVLRVTPAGQGFVLYQAPKREITALAVAADGSLYAAGVGDKAPTPAPASVITPPPAAPPKPAEPAKPTLSGQLQTAPSAQAAPPSGPVTPAPPAGGSEIYRIAPDGQPRTVWRHAQETVYTIAFDREGRPLVGTGNRGMIYRLESPRLHTALVAAPPTQVTCLLAAADGSVYAATGNIGKVFRMGPSVEKDGVVESEVFDAGVFSLWGRLGWRGDTHGGQVRFETRSGNVDRPRKDWSPWEPLDADGRVRSPRARFLQWRLTLGASPEGRSPEVSVVEVAYLPRNIAPVVSQIEITPPNYRFPPQALTLTQTRSINLPPLGQGRRSAPPTPVASGSVTMQYEKGHIGARWAASDDNDDELLFKVEIRGENESEWKLLKDELKDRQLSWDSTAFPDGRYLLRVTASDAPDNPPDQALTATLVSEPFLIDNTPPQITGLSATAAGGRLEVRWQAQDAWSVITKAEYSLNGGPWVVAEPTTKLSDSRRHDYRLLVERASPGEQTVAVRVTDEYDNQAVEKVVVR
ncbi:MAG: hypothetical protein RMK57_04640 [Bryobacterales bacterium]|nr:hypothetical protein [Bryobacteraceae bacterium]MDW8353799.1 hypothetical protein [Bryobacterales bacterium]